MRVDSLRANELAMSNLMAVFNERDPERRQAAIDTTYSTNVVIYEPENIGEGRDAVNQLCQTLLDQYSGWNFKPTGPVKCTQNMVTIPWSFGPDDEPSKLTGSDVILVGSGSLIDVVYVVIDAVCTVSPNGTK